MNGLAPSLLSADFANLGAQVHAIDAAGAEYVHFDVMDGIFVPSISMGLPIIRSIRPVSKKIFDVHLMIQEPDRYIGDFAQAGADIITVHAEACLHLDRTIQKIKEKGALAGVALNPSTPLSALEYVIDEIDMALIMTVNPGFGGQTLIPYTLRKIKDLKHWLWEKKKKIPIEADGGITLDNVTDVLDAGANLIVSGSAVFQGNIEENVKGFLRRMDAWERR